MDKLKNKIMVKKQQANNETIEELVDSSIKTEEQSETDAQKEVRRVWSLYKEKNPAKYEQKIASGQFENELKRAGLIK